MFWTLHLIGWLSLHCLYFFWSFDLFFHLGHISLCRCTCYVVKGRTLGIRQGGATHVAALWCCMSGRGQRGNSAACSALGWLSVTFPATHTQTGPFWCWFQGGWFYIHSIGPWGSLLPTPVRLGVSPATAIPTGFSVRGFEALFPRAGTLGCTVSLAPQLFLLVYLHENVGPLALPAATSPAQVLQPWPCW